GKLRRPKTEAIMMLGRQYQPLHSGFFCRAYNLRGVKVGRIEECRIFISIAPLFVGKGVDTEMQKPIKLELVPTQLPGGRNRTIGRRRRDALKQSCSRYFSGSRYGRSGRSGQTQPTQKPTPSEFHVSEHRHQTAVSILPAAAL